MNNGKLTRYVTPELELIMFEHNDIITTSGGGGAGNGNGYVSDPNEDTDW